MLSLVMKDQLKIIELYYTEESIKSIITGNKPKVRCDKRYNTYALKLPIFIVASPVWNYRFTLVTTALHTGENPSSPKWKSYPTVLLTRIPTDLHPA